MALCALQCAPGSSACSQQLGSAACATAVRRHSARDSCAHVWDSGFASAGAAASISYAYILGLAPYGILAGSVLTPLLRALSVGHVEVQFTVVSMTVSTLARIMLPLALLISTLAEHLVTLALSGGVFAAAEVAAVARLLPLVQLSAMFGVVRDILMRVHYVRGTGWIVLRLNIALLVLNLALDVAVVAVGFGAFGLLASTVLINLCACVLVWWSITAAPGKARSAVACGWECLVALALSSVAWLFAHWASPAMRCQLSPLIGADMFGQTLSRAGAAAACASFCVPMAVCYVVLLGVYQLLKQ
jgi:peptidoglycan biosynthesis protein MviN/MurJ (putative lipid II flippase)